MCLTSGKEGGLLCLQQSLELWNEPLRAEASLVGTATALLQIASTAKSRMLK